MNGYNDIIKSLDGWLERPAAIEPPTSKPQEYCTLASNAPRYEVGDTIVIRETRWQNGPVVKVNKQTGLYFEPGYPKTREYFENDQQRSVDEDDVKHILQEKLSGVALIGDRCRVMANWFDDKDKRWYYFLALERSHSDRGWTRCDFRFEKVV